VYHATKFPFCQEKNDYPDMNEKFHAEIVMNKKGGMGDTKGCLAGSKKV